MIIKFEGGGGGGELEAPSLPALIIWLSKILHNYWYFSHNNDCTVVYIIILCHHIIIYRY